MTGKVAPRSWPWENCFVSSMQVQSFTTENGTYFVHNVILFQSKSSFFNQKSSFFNRKSILFSEITHGRP